MIHNVSTKFYLNLNKKRKDGKFPIYLRIIMNRLKTEIALDKTIAIGDWNEYRQRARKDNLVNEHLNSIEAKVLEASRTLEKDGRNFDARMLKDIVTGKLEQDVYLCEYFQSHIAQQQRNPELKPGTISRYRDTLEHIKDYIKLERKANDLLISRIDLKFVKAFDLYLLNHYDEARRKTLDRNTVNKHMVRFKTIILKANAEGILKDNPFKAIRLKYSPSKRDFLTQDEVDRLAGLDLGSNPTLDKVRDLFIWSVYTGLRFADAQALTMKEIKVSKDGSMTLLLKQEKTGELASIPLFSKAISIVEKYEKGERKITGKILPRISNQKANVYLRHLAVLAGIDKELSTHVARHTCATTILLSNRVPIEAVSKWLGHTNIRTTQIYAKITGEYLASIAKQLDRVIEAS